MMTFDIKKHSVVDLNDVASFKQKKCNISKYVAPLAIEFLAKQKHNFIPTIIIQGDEYLLNKCFLINTTAGRHIVYVCGKYTLIACAAAWGIYAIYNSESQELFTHVHINNSVKRYTTVYKEFYTLVNKFYDEYVEYIHKNDNYTFTTCFITEQISHHIQNEFSYVATLIELYNIKTIYSWCEYIVSHEDYFNNVEIVRNLTNEQMFIETINKNLLILKGKTGELRKEHLERIKTCLTTKPLSKKTKKSFLLTIRTTVRVLTNQYEFLVNSIKCLEEVYPNSTYYLDGRVNWIQYAYVRGMQDNVADTLDDEQILANNIIKDLPTINIVSLIRKPIKQYLRYLDHVDLFITHCGTPQVKLGYFTKCGGLRHGLPTDTNIEGTWRPRIKETYATRLESAKRVGEGRIVTNFPLECFTPLFEGELIGPGYKSYTANIDKCVCFIKQYISQGQ